MKRTIRIPRQEAFSHAVKRMARNISADSYAEAVSRDTEAKKRVTIQQERCTSL